MFALITVVFLQTASVARTLERQPELVDATKIVNELQVDLKYATKDNFTGQNLYGDLDRCFLHRDAAAMLAEAQDVLMTLRPDLRLHAYDCARPATVQWRMWAVVKGTPSQKYVANPKNGSIHSYGCAIDLTIATREGKPVDMGTPYDFFGAAAHPENEAELLALGELSNDQVKNRRLLRKVMTGAGFRSISHEWWHFDCAPHAETRRRFKIIP
jgi:zinc D-Ala-D-Ala dipeptidase